MQKIMGSVRGGIMTERDLLQRIADRRRTPPPELLTIHKLKALAEARKKEAR